MNRLLISSLLASTLLTPCYANFIFTTHMDGGCEELPGRWAGTGKAYYWLLGECVYHGEGVASELDAAGNFSLVVEAEKDSGSFICPQHQTTALNGICVGNTVTFVTEYGNLIGSYANKTGAAKGSIRASAGIYVDVDIQFRSGE